MPSVAQTGDTVSLGRISPGQKTPAQFALAPHHMQDEDAPAVISIENPARRLDDLPVAPAAQLRGPGTALRMLGKHGDVTKDGANQPARCLRVVERDMVGNGVEIVERGLGPAYFSHRAMRFAAWAWVNTRPSSTAFSPRAMPSSSAKRRCCRS